MKRRISVLCFLMCLVCMIVTCLTACGSSDGTYYLYENGSYDESDYITIRKDTWTDSSGASGPVERDGNKITLYISLFGDEEIVWEGTCQKGVLTLSDGYQTAYFCKKGKTPAGADHNGDNTTGGGSGTGGSGTGGVTGDGPNVTLTFRTQGGKELPPITAPAGSSVSIPTPEYDGYIFKGWYLSRDYLSKEKFESATMPDSDTTLWAKWEKKPVEYKNDYLTATGFTKWNDSHYAFSGEKMTIRYTSDEHRPGSTYNLNTGIEAKSGYNIVWYQDEDCTITIGTQRDKLSYGDNIYYATIVDAKNGQFVEKYMINVYVRHDYTYTYYPYAPGYALGGVLGEYYSERVIEDDTTHAPQAPDTGYTFKRWVTQNRDGDYTEYNYNTPATGNRYFYAEWESVSLTLNTGDGATLLAGSSTTVSFSPFGTSSVNVIPTMETQVFLGYYAGNTRYFDENGKLLTPLPVSATGSLSAAYGDSQDPVLRFTVNNGGYTVFMNKMPTYETKVVIPATYQSKPVTAIGARAFAGYKRLTNVLIPNSVTSIGYEAFSGCTGLTSITIPNKVTSIGSSAFSGCTGLTSITIPDSVTSIGGSAFSGCTGLTSITIPFVGGSADATSDSESTLFGYIFGTSSYTGGTEIKQPYGSNNYATYYIPSGLKKVTVTGGNLLYGAFYGCTGLNSVTIGNGVTSIGNYAFRDCTGLTSVTIENGVTSIGDYAFSRCTGLTSVTIENGVTSIGDYAFINCKELTSITIPNSVTSIGDYAFRDCTGLTSVTIENGVTSIGYKAFSGCAGLTSITIPNSVKSIGSYAFHYCSGLTSVTIGNSVTSIGGYAFSYCTGLTSITIPNSVKSIGGYAFSGCAGLTSITIPFVGGGASATGASSSTLFGYIFGKDSYTGGTATTPYYNSGSSVTYYIPSSLKEVTVTGGNLLYRAFYGCTGLNSVTIGNGVTSIEQYAFDGCKGLTSITIPNSVTSIGKHAFYDCTALANIRYTGTLAGWCGITGLWYLMESGRTLTIDGKEVTGALVIPDNVTSIGGYAFSYCTGLTSITIPNSVKNIGGDAFYGCTALKAINYTGDIAGWCGITGLGNLMASDRALTISGNAVTGALVIPDGVTSIADSAFRYCTGLTSVTIPASVTNIGANAFGGCTAIRQATLPMTAISAIPKDSLETVTINGGTSIPASAFSNCTKLTSVAIPASVTSIGDFAFSGCTAKIIWGGTPTIQTIGDYAFAGYKGTELTIPTTVTSIGYKAFDGCTGLTSIAIPDSVTSIGSNAFYGCTGLTSVTIGNGVKSIGSSAFSGCTAKIIWGSTPIIQIIGDYAFAGYKGTELTIPATVTSIGDDAFSGCTELTSVTIGSGVTSIGDNAFSGCSALKTVNYAGALAGWCGITGLENLMASDRTLTIDGKEVTGALVIPDGVTSIGSSAFSGCTGLTSVTIGNGVTSIGSGAFSGCSSLASITLPFVGGSASATSDSSSTLFGYIFGTSSYTGGTATRQYYNSGSSITYYIPSSLKEVTVTGGNLLYGAFYNCTGLTSITIPDNVTSIGDDAFYNCTGLTSITIPDSVTSIGSKAFTNCTRLTSVTIPASVTSIGSSAFSGCAHLTSITIPNSVTSIGYEAFSGCTGLTSIAIPNSVTSIGNGAFSGCAGLTSITLPFVGGSASATSVSWSTLFGYIFGEDSYTGGTATKQYYDSGDYASETYYIPSALREVTVTGGNLLYGAFFGCTGLTSVTIGNGVTSIGDAAFRGCTRLTSVTIGNGVTSIGDYAFYGCTGLTSITIPNSVTSIGSSAFYGCTGLTSLTIGNGVTSIGDRALYNCSGLNSVTIGNGVTSIGSCAFYGCSSLTSITIPNSVTSIGSSAFYDCTGLTSVTIGNGVTSIGSCAFYGCTGLTSIIIPNSVTSIESYAFYYCTGLTSITIPNSVTSIGSGAFSRCTGLTSVTIPNNVTSIGSSAFSGCSSLTSITLPFVGGSASATSASSSTLFGYIFGTSSYTGGTATKQYYDSNNYATYYIPSSLKEVTVTGKQVLYGAFYNCTGLTSVTIGNGVTSIGSSAFSGCSSLTSITIPFVGGSASATSASESTLFGYIFGTSSYTGGMATRQFYGSYATYYIPSGLKKVTVTGGNLLYGAFYNCTGLTSVTIGNSVTSIGSYAFYGCTGLTSVTIGNGVTSIGSYAFYGCTGLTSVTIGNGVKSIGEYAFRGCTGLTSITIPNSVTSIADSAFRYCTGLTSVTIGNGVTSIGSSAFYGCEGLTSITIPNSVKNIGSSAFSGCTGLTSITIPFVGGSADATSDSESTLFGYIFGTSSYTGGTATKPYYNSGSSITYYIPSSLKEVTVTGGNLLYGAFWGCTGLTSVTIGSGVTSIGDRAFYGCTGLTSVTIGNGVTSTGDWAFYGCTGLTSVTIENGVTSIGDAAFRGCTRLTFIIIPNSVTSIGDSAFSSCTGLTSITIPNSVTSIGYEAFRGCTGLTMVTIGNSVTSIGRSAFYECTGLTSITIPNSVTSIGESAFRGCSNLTSVTFTTTSGWYCTENSTATSGTSIDVTNAATNAKNLTSTYCDYYWKRKG